MKIRNTAGFTLIELLVVIAIIGILSSVVLASLNSARAKGADAAIKANLANIRAQAELFYDNNAGKYSTDTTVLASTGCPNSSSNTMFNADATIKAAIESARSANGGAIGTVTRCAIGVSGGSYAVAVQLKSSTNWYCVDSAGNAATETANPPGLAGNTVAAVCP